MNDKQRIMLAEAMFPGQIDHTHFPELRVWRGKWTPFDPLTDANDDYAVLRWMRESHHWQAFKEILHKDRLHAAVWMCGRFTWNYQIGDYARAAVAVLEADEKGQ